MHANPLPTPYRTPAPGLWASAGLIVFYFLLQAVTATLAVLVINMVAGSGHTGPKAGLDALLRPATQALLAILSLAVAAPVTLWLARRKWLSLWTMARPPGLGFTMPVQWGFLVLAVVAGLAAPLLGGVLTQWLAHDHAVTQDIRQLGASTPLAWRIPLVLMVVAVGPLVEELLFRGVLLSALLRYMPTVWAVLLCSLAFALVHLPGLQYEWYALPALTLLALILAWLRLHSGSIWPAVLAHAANNLLAVTTWFVVSGPGG